MADALFTIPVPSTAFVQEARFAMLLGRECSLSYSYEAGEDGQLIFEELVFGGVEGFKCTYYCACSVDMITSAYDRVVEVDFSKWLAEIVSNLKAAHWNAEGLKHLRIYFDDGPCYEFVCRSFRVSTKRGPIARNAE